MNFDKYKKKIFDKNEGDVVGAFYSKWAVSILYIMNSLVLEIVMFSIMQLGALPQYLALDFAIVFIIAAFLFMLPSFNLQKIMFAVMVFLHMILVFANCSLYKYHGDVFSLGILGFAREGAAVIEIYMLEMKCVPIFLLLAVSDIYMINFINKGSPRKFPLTSKTIAGLLAFFIAFTSFGVCVYNIEKARFSKDSNDKYLYDTLMFRNAAMSKFGGFTFYFKELTGENLSIITNDLTEAEVLNKLNNFTPVNSDNPYLNQNKGIIKDDNVISILLESVEWYMIDEILTPVLYKLFNGYNFAMDGQGKELGYGKTDADKRGVVFDQYYSKSKTDFSEASALLGSYPYYESFSSHSNIMGAANNSVKSKDLSFSIPGMLKMHTGIETAGYLHSYLSTFYGRPDVMPVFGFDELMFIEDLDIPYSIAIGNSVLDSDVMDLESVKDLLMPAGKKFYSHYSVITTHGPYTYSPGLKKYYEEINAVAARGLLPDYLTSNSYAVGYLAKTMDLDRAVEKIIVDLQETGRIDNTTFLMFSDHQAYYHGIDMTYKKEVLGYESAFDPERYRIPAVIYSTNLPYLKVDRFVNYFDFAPTLFDLMDIPYNPNIYLGNSVFSDEASKCLISRTGGVFNERIFTMDGKIEKFRKTGVTDAEVRDFSNNVDKLLAKWDYVDYMYYYNLYPKVFNYKP